MPSKGKDMHSYLKNCANKKLLEIYGSAIDYLRMEQPSDFNDLNGKNYFKTTASIGVGLYDNLKSENLNFPDIFAQINLSEKEKKIANEKGKSLAKKFIVVECETQKTSWFSDVNDPRNIGYRLIKSKRDDIVLVLATFKDIKVKTDLFDRVWRFEKPSNIK